MKNTLSRIEEYEANFDRIFIPKILALLKEYGEEIIGEDETWKFMDGKAKECEIRNQLRQEQRAILQNKMKEIKS